MKKFDIHEWQASQIKQRLVEQNIDSKNPDRDPWQDLYGKQNPNDPKAIPGKHFPSDDNLDKTKDSLDSFFGSGKSFKPNSGENDLESEISKYIGQTFASWMSPDNPPFAQEYAKPPYMDKLVKGIMDILPTNMSEAEVTGMEPDTGNMEKEYKIIGPKNQSKPLDDVTIEYNGQTYELDFEYGDVIDDHGNEGKDLWFEATADDGTYFMVDVYASNYDNTGDVDEIFWNTLEIESSKDPRMDPAIRSDFDDPVIDEQNSLGAAGSGASFTPGNGMGFMSPKIFKRKNKLN